MFDCIKHYVSLSALLLFCCCCCSCSGVVVVVVVVVVVEYRIAFEVVVFRSLNNGFWEDARIGNVGITSIRLIDVAFVRSHLLMIFLLRSNVYTCLRVSVNECERKKFDSIGRLTIDMKGRKLPFIIINTSFFTHSHAHAMNERTNKKKH